MIIGLLLAAWLGCGVWYAREFFTRAAGFVPHHDWMDRLLAVVVFLALVALGPGGWIMFGLPKGGPNE